MVTPVGFETRVKTKTPSNVLAHGLFEDWMPLG